ncbi:MAG: hypothetical protein NUW23_04660 [Firmicutes bacterium]|jgi:hypothetical protein|nr:hypothetical protein [Bacillota bacterium]
MRSHRLLALAPLACALALVSLSGFGQTQASPVPFISIKPQVVVIGENFEGAGKAAKAAVTSTQGSVTVSVVNKDSWIDVHPSSFRFDRPGSQTVTVSVSGNLDLMPGFKKYLKGVVGTVEFSARNAENMVMMRPLIVVALKLFEEPPSLSIR